MTAKSVLVRPSAPICLLLATPLKMDHPIVCNLILILSSLFYRNIRNAQKETAKDNSVT